MWVREVYLVWNGESALSEAALASRAPCLVVFDGGMGVFDVMFVGFGFEVGVAEGCGVALWWGYACIWPCQGADRHM